MEVVSKLCSFKLNISQTFGVVSIYGHTHTHVYARTYTTWSGVSLLIISQTRTQVGHNRTRSICEVFHEAGSVTKFDKFQHEKNCKRFSVSNRVEIPVFRFKAFRGLLYPTPLKS